MINETTCERWGNTENIVTYKFHCLIVISTLPSIASYINEKIISSDIEFFQSATEKLMKDMINNKCNKAKLRKTIDNSKKFLLREITYHKSYSLKGK